MLPLGPAEQMDLGRVLSDMCQKAMQKANRESWEAVPGAEHAFCAHDKREDESYKGWVLMSI